MRSTVDTIIDTGPLVAVLNRSDDYHADCSRLIRALDCPFYATMAVLTEVMGKYNDRPMDFADASLVALAERLSLDRIFTADRHDFSVYRLHGKKPFTIIGP